MHAAAHNNLGSVLDVVRKDYDRAEELYRKAIELGPKHALAHNNLGTLLRDVRKDYDGAEELFRKAIELDPKDANAHVNLGHLLQNGCLDFAVWITRCHVSDTHVIRKDYDNVWFFSR